VKAKIWQAQWVRERVLRFCGKHAWVLSLPFLAYAACGWAFDGDLRFVIAYLVSQLLFYGIPVMLLAALGVAYLVATKRFGSGEVEVDDEGLTLGTRRLAHGDIATAWGIAADELEILTHDGDQLHVRFQDPHDARAVGAALRAASPRGKSWALDDGAHVGRTFRKLAGTYLPLSIAATFVGAVWQLAPLLPVAALLSFAIARGVRRARFGADGVHVEGRFRRRFVPYRDIERVHTERGPFSHRVRVSLRDGSSQVILRGMGQVRARLLCALIEEGMAMVGEGADAGAQCTDLRPGLDDAQLRRRLLSVAKAGQYRGAAFDADRLDRLVRNPAAPPDQRIAAAWALRESAGGRRRIRVAAEVSEDPQVRVALEALSEDELDADRERQILRQLGR